MSIIPLFFWIIVLLAVFVGIATKFFGLKFMSGNTATMIFVGYVAILLVTAILSGFLPEENSFAAKYRSDEEINENERLNSRVYEQVESGNIKDAKGLTEKENWEFTLDNDVLKINSDGDSSSMVYVEKKDSLKGKVEVAHYSTFSYVDNMDVTDLFESPEIRLNDGTLKIYPREAVNIKLVKFSNAFPFNQFAENNEKYGVSYGMMQGLDFIYITVPADTEVSGDGYVIN
ncbi:hypothetical protein M3172_15630 [Mesobacillus subterraneus]|uniref:hypothetical protein n=1 Tax=Mesobacillus subterraneus TaxID=285983 RepID=UPI00203E5880|nr:hypothetical protein [Mesobacillus subterraneus]MCM3574626.1 hypothetical protein [Mesobacillus subterraneus]